LKKYGKTFDLKEKRKTLLKDKATEFVGYLFLSLTSLNGAFLSYAVSYDSLIPTMLFSISSGTFLSSSYESIQEMKILIDKLDE